MKNRDNGKYTLPFKSYSSLRLGLHFLYVIMFLMFGGFVFIPFDNGIEGVFFRTMFAFIAITIGCLWFYTGILKKQYIEVTDDYFKYKSLFITKKINWDEIYDVQVFTQNYNTFIGIALKEKLRKRKESFWSMINDMYGGMYSVRVIMGQFSEVNIERLYGTIVDKLIEVNDKEESFDEGSLDFNEIKSEEDIESSNYFLAVFKALFLSIIIGIGYGLLIYFLEVNIVMIPIFGTIAIIYYYSKAYREVKINILARTLIGLICSLQIFIAVILVIFMDNDISFTLKNLIDVTKEYFSYLLEEPFEQGIIIFIALICFGFGAFQGHSFKFQRKIKKLLMKQSGRYYFTKEGRVVTIYLIDPVQYDDNNQDKFFINISRGCLIERDGKKIKGLYIPGEYIEETGIKLSCDYQTIIENKEYCKIDMGSSGGFQPYTFPFILIMDSNRKVEVIKIEI